MQLQLSLPSVKFSHVIDSGCQLPPVHFFSINIVGLVTIVIINKWLQLRAIFSFVFGISVFESKLYLSFCAVILLILIRSGLRNCVDKGELC